jgi:predicted HicB family RNase H-like nuclease
MNTIEIEGYRAVIQHDQNIEMFRGAFIDLNGYLIFMPGILKAYLKKEEFL